MQRLNNFKSSVHLGCVALVVAPWLCGLGCEDLVVGPWLWGLGCGALVVGPWLYPPGPCFYTLAFSYQLHHKIF